MLIEDVHAPVDADESWETESGLMYLRFETDGSVSGASGYAGFVASISREPAD